MLHYKLNKYKDWWNGFAVREQRLLALGAFILLMGLVYLLIWSPMDSATTRMRSGIASNEKLLAYMQAIDSEMSALGGHRGNQEKNKTYSPVEVITLLQNQINNAGIKGQLTQLKQASKDEIEMHFQKVEFDKLSEMLIHLAKNQGIKIVQIGIKREPKVGHVSADIIVSM